MVQASGQSNSNKTISLLDSTAPLFKSAAVSLWPVSFFILNLPSAVCMISENIVLAGFWIGSKPPIKCLFDPIIERLNSYHHLA